MAKEYDNSGIVYRNRDKDEDGANPKWPDIKGSATVHGVEYWVSGWQKDGDKGKFYSLSFEPKEKKQGARGHPSVKSGDDIPFADPYKGRKSYVE